MVIVDFGIKQNLILLFLANKKIFSIQKKKKNCYNLIIIDRNLLLSKNRIVD